MGHIGAVRLLIGRVSRDVEISCSKTDKNVMVLLKFSKYLDRTWNAVDVKTAFKNTSFAIVPRCF